MPSRGLEPITYDLEGRRSNQIELTRRIYIPLKK